MAKPGSIPACAGKPDATAPFRRVRRVHPRVCGEARINSDDSVGPSGPSPRVRGSPQAHPLVSVVHGSIPACAGKPRGGRGDRRSGRVHPRVCGEARTE